VRDAFYTKYLFLWDEVFSSLHFFFLQELVYGLYIPFSFHYVLLRGLSVGLYHISPQKRSTLNFSHSISYLTMANHLGCACFSFE